ncbi:Serine/threonine-protein phosphatase PP1-2 [Tritrichomonas foetus]|uniref:Serine/threonine-protein phosphatase n=1 Tax=Tritrichomonas foetus TaxID=1144522 RepID=A0A1J4J4H3_9EUKA|nr:Serine/threonine-protein phosphatase PP1-2 [Tritrichomonas foetus]|eukprot:OHS93617.1 Serine/threonine-protein phosphatase PP1-2 [Tritrichomonas foetus]
MFYFQMNTLKGLDHLLNFYSNLYQSKMSEHDPFIRVNQIIDKLWGIVDKSSDPDVLTINEIKLITDRAKTTVALQPVCLELLPPLVVCGDIHGQFFDLLRIFHKCGDPKNTNYLFLGDYVDRGKLSINTICLLLLYKIKYPKNFFLLRGNHESAMINKQYGFFEECKRKYNTKIFEWFNDVFDWLPISAMIDNRILCTHGGISPNLNSITQLKEIKRPLQIPETGLVCDLLWSDPDSDCEDFEENDRGTGFVYGSNSAQSLLDKCGLDLIVRAHQSINRGYDFPFKPVRNVVTVFSAPNYCGEYGNSGAVMTVSENMVCKFVTFKPMKRQALISDIQRPVPYSDDLNVSDSTIQ